MGATPQRVLWLSALVAIAAVAASAGLAFGRTLQGAAPTVILVASGIAAGTLAWLTERRGMLWATIASAVGLLLVIGWTVALHTTWFGLPTASTFHTLALLASGVGSDARTHTSPAPATPSLLLACELAVWTAVFSCYALAFRARSPLLALVPPLALVVFADSVLEQFPRPIFGVLFLCAALGVLFVDSLRRIQGWGPMWADSGEHRVWSPVGRNARRVGVAVVSAALVAPLVVPGFGSRIGTDAFNIRGSGRINVSPFASLDAILRDQQSRTTKMFEIRARVGSYWRMLGLDTFDGTNWEADPLAEQAVVPGTTFNAAHAATGREVTQVISVENDLGFPYLPAAADPVSIAADGDVVWDQTSSSLQAGEPLDANDTYTVTSVEPRVTSEDLDGLGAIPALDPTLTSLPLDIPPIVKEKALRWTEGLTTTYQQVRAIELHLKSAPFVYDPLASYPPGPQTLATILTDTRRGFCQHFASLMAVMLREIGIPARVAFGFTPGTPVHDTWTVTGADLHTWVEVPFPDAGWVSFDPTPMSPSTGPWDPSVDWNVPPVGCRQTRSCGDAGDGVTSTAPPTTGITKPLPGAEVGQADALSSGGRGYRIAMEGVFALLLIAGALARRPIARRIRQRKRLRAARDPRTVILTTYDVFAERAAELGWSRMTGETPEEFHRRIEEAGILPESDGPTLRILTSSVVQAAYAGKPPTDADAAHAGERASSVLAGLRDATPILRRALGSL